MARMYAKCLLVTLLILGWSVSAQAANTDLQDKRPGSLAPFKRISLQDPIRPLRCNCSLTASALDSNAVRTARFTNTVKPSESANTIVGVVIREQNSSPIRPKIFASLVESATSLAEKFSPISNSLIRGAIKTGSKIGDLASFPFSDSATLAVNPLPGLMEKQLAEVTSEIIDDFEQLRSMASPFVLPSSVNERPTNQVAHKTKSNRVLKETMDDYWQYYAACDRWEVIFVSAIDKSQNKLTLSGRIQPLTWLNRATNFTMVTSSIKDVVANHDFEKTTREILALAKRIELNLIEAIHQSRETTANAKITREFD